MIDEVYKRIIQFAIGCFVSECVTIHRLARFALLLGRMNSILGRNTIFFSIRYELDTIEVEHGILISVARVLSMNHLPGWNFD